MNGFNVLAGSDLEMSIDPDDVCWCDDLLQILRQASRPARAGDCKGTALGSRAPQSDAVENFVPTAPQRYEVISARRRRRQDYRSFAQVKPGGRAKTVRRGMTDIFFVG